MSSLSGKQKYQEASAAENQLRELGSQQMTQGGRVLKPNLLRFKEDARISKADREIAAGKAKAAGAEAGDAATQSAMGLRAGRGVNSASYRLGLEKTTAARGRADAQAQVETAQNMDAMDLKAKGAIAGAATGQMTESMEGLRAGASAQAAAQMARTANENAQRERDANERTQLLMAGLKGASYLGGKLGTEMKFGADGKPTGIGYTDGFFGGLAKLGFADDTEVLRHRYDIMGGGPKNPGLFGGLFQTPAQRQAGWNAQLPANDDEIGKALDVLMRGRRR